MKNKRKVKEAMPVSVKYYKTLRARVDEIVESIRGFKDGEWVEFVMSMIDDYLRGNQKVFYISGRASVECEVICLTLKAEIDRAVERAARARERAILRRKQKEAVEAEKSEKGENSEKLLEEVEKAEIVEVNPVIPSAPKPTRDETDREKPTKNLKNH